MSVSQLRFNSSSPVAPDHFGFSDRTRRTVDQPIGFLIAMALTNPGLISLAAGLVDYETLPSPECRELVQQLLTDDSTGRSRLQFGTTLGLPGLRQQLLQHLATLDGQNLEQFGATADQIIITTGSQQLLALLTDVLVNPGDIVLTGWPSYFVYTGVLLTAGALVRGIDTDDEGIIPARLQATLQAIQDSGQLSRVKIVYAQSYHDNPTGLTLAVERRPQVVEIVKRFSRYAGHRILLMEDAAYRELTFAGDPPPSIRSFDTDHQHVALLQTFSKPFAPGVKVGYGLLPRELVEPVRLQKDNLDFGTANLNQHLLLRAMQSGLYDRHVAMLRARYRDKAAYMLAALDEHLGDFPAGEAHWTHPRGGLYVWLTLPAGIDTGRSGALFERCVREGVLYVPGAYCYGSDSTRHIPTNTLRLSFGTATLEHIREGIRRLSVAIRGCLT